MFAAASPDRKVAAARRLLGLTHNGPLLCQFISVLAESPILQPDGLNMAAQMLNEAFAEYPIVIAFVALMLQRRAHSTVALRLYLLDSAVVPSGASSVGLLAAMGAQYFLALYAKPHLANLVTPALLFNGTWLAVNVGLTGYFLTRTVSFIQEEQSRKLFASFAVRAVFKRELMDALTQAVAAQAPSQTWRLGAPTAASPVVVGMWSIGDPVVVKLLEREHVLADMYLRPLGWVAKRWHHRAVTATSLPNARPMLAFLPLPGNRYNGKVDLCCVRDGPKLTALEQLVVRHCFAFRRVKARDLSLTTEMMLVEVAEEAIALAEQGRHSAARDVVRHLVDMHRLLLRASSFEVKEEPDSAALIGPVTTMPTDRSFSLSWMKAYRELARVAVLLLEEDRGLFRQVAYVPIHLGKESANAPPKVATDSFHACTTLAYQLGIWWTRRAQASLPVGATTFDGNLPAPLYQVYENALTDLLGAWTSIRFDAERRKDLSVAAQWGLYVRRTTILAKHIDESARLVLNAVSRGDEAASQWLCDSYLKWWGNREHDLECGHLEYEERFRHLGLSLAELQWDAVQVELWDGTEPVTIGFAEQTLNVALRRYWEQMRLLLILVLLQKAGEAADETSREIRLAAALINGKPLKRGGSVVAAPLGAIDAVLAACLEVCFGDATVTKRLDAFSEGLRWDENVPEVSGWMYGWSGGVTDVESMRTAQAQLLFAVSSARRLSVRESKLCIESWWRDHERLAAVAQYCDALRREVLQVSFSTAGQVARALQKLVGGAQPGRRAWLAVAEATKQLKEVAVHERRMTLRSRTVSTVAVRRIAERVAHYAFTPEDKARAQVQLIQFASAAPTDESTMSFELRKEEVLESASPLPDARAEHYGKHAWRLTLQNAFAKQAARSGLRAIPSASLKAEPALQVSVATAFLTDVLAKCTTLKAADRTPIILVSGNPLKRLFRPYTWHQAGKSMLPPSIVVRIGRREPPDYAEYYLNDVPVLDFPTQGECYVVAGEDISTLQVSGSAAEAMRSKWHVVDDDKVVVELRWSAAMRPQAPNGGSNAAS